MIKEFFRKKILDHQLKNVPPAQREMILAMMEKDPELFKQIAKDIKEEMGRRGDKDQEAAAMIVMPKYQKQLQALMGGPQRAPQRFNSNGSIRK